MFLKLSAALSVALVLGGAEAAQAVSELEVVTRSEVTFQPLNPLRGDKSPQAGVLWGDIKQHAATGTLVQFRDGFSSPPHIHNITYRAVVISGEVHNDDPEAAPLWMEPGSFWTQPAGETHITAAQGERTTILLEIMEGPYLVQPSNEAFDNGERPVNIAARNVVWLDGSDVSWINSPTGSDGPEISFLWGVAKDGQRHGAFLRLPAGSAGRLESQGDWLKAVTVAGTLDHHTGDSGTPVRLELGSYFGAPNSIGHSVTCAETHDCLLYVTALGKFSFDSP
ncbi:MAG: DUF4437 domain-containing protein [Rhodospirillaceae bacterium]